jgi:hypothetical protein
VATANSRRNTDAEVNDLYTTPHEVTEAAISHGVFEGVSTVYDPCDGLGGITDTLIANGLFAHSSDLIDYGVGSKIVDFLKVETIPNGVDAIVFNPPFKLTYEFMEKAREFNKKIIMFNRVSFLETQKRAEKMSYWGLTDIHLFAYRVGCSKGGVDKPSNAVFYAWYVFDPEKYEGITKTHWITR